MTVVKADASHPGYECRVCGGRFAFGFRGLAEGARCKERGCLGTLVLAVARTRAA
jgi:hypothetical protein